LTYNWKNEAKKEDEKPKESMAATLWKTYREYGIFLHPLYGYPITRMDEPNLINVGVRIWKEEDALAYVDDLPVPPRFMESLRKKMKA